MSIYLTTDPDWIQHSLSTDYSICAVSQCVNLTPFYFVCALFYSVCALCVFVAQVDTSTVHTWARQGALLSAGARL